MSRIARQIIRQLNDAADEESIENADQAELQAIRDSCCVIETAIHDELTLGQLRERRIVLAEDGETEVSELSWMEVADDEEEAVGRTAEEIQRRALLLGEDYPFEFKGQSLQYKRSPHGFYEFCLAVSTGPTLTKGEYCELPRAFERFAKDTLVAWSGHGAQGWQTGWPGRMDIGLPSELPDLWRQIHEQTREWRWQPGDDVPALAEQDQKDLGVDVLVWKQIPDERSGSLFFAGQCACGRDALTGRKTCDLNRSWLDNWFTRLKVEYVPCLLLPRCLGGSANALRARSGVLFFDRVRLLLASRASRQQIASAALKPYHDLASIVLHAN